MPLSLKALRLSTAELLACSLCDLFPGTLLIGSVVTDIGFHYDCILKNPIDHSALPLIEERMRTLVRQDIPVKTLDMMRQNAVTFLAHQGQKLKANIASIMPNNVIQLIQIGNFVDICLPPYMTSTSEIASFRLQSIETLDVSIKKNDGVVTRIHGTAFPDNASLKQFIKRAEEAKKRDHKLIGKEMGLYSFHHETEFCLWNPKGTILRELLKDWWNKILDNQEFALVTTMPMVPSAIVKTQKNDLSCHSEIENDDYLACSDPTPLHALMFATEQPTESELPIRYRAMAPITRNLSNEEVCGLLQSRNCERDYAQTFCSPGQVAEELISSLQFIDKIIKIFGFEHQWYFHTHRAPQVNKVNWTSAVELLETAMKACGIGYILDKDKETRYGPRVEIGLTDAYGRTWAGPHVLIDVMHPELYELHYRKSDESKQRPVLISRSNFGSIDRFIAVLIEHYAGILPLWFTPEQVRIIPVGPKQAVYAESLRTAIKEKGFRVGIDNRLDALGERVRKAELARVPYIVVVGENEVKKQLITVRSGSKAAVRNGVALGSFLEQLQEEGGALSLTEQLQVPCKQDRELG